METSWIGGRTAIVTGATSGIGRATAEALARRGARVVLVARDAGRGERTRAELAAATGSAAIEVVVADLAAPSSIRSLAAGLLAGNRSVHALINNAGVFEARRRQTAEGIEMTFAVNTVAPFLLTALLLDRLRASAPARIVNVSSAMQAGARIDLDDLQYRHRRYTGWSAYAQSKLALLALTLETAGRLAGSGVTANAVHPGFVRTNLGARGGLVRLGWAIACRFAVVPEVGARTSVLVTSAAALGDVTGRYFAGERPASYNPLADDPAVRARLWSELESLTDTGRPSGGARA